MKYSCKVCGGSIRYFEEVMGSFSCGITDDSSPDFANREFVGDAVSIGVECSKDALHECGYYYDISTKKIVDEDSKGMSN